MNIKSYLTELIQGGVLDGKTEYEICRYLRIAPREAAYVCDILDELCKNGVLLCRGGRYTTPQKAGAVRGKIVGNEKGFGFLIRDDGAPDLFIPAKYMGNAMHGDTVLALPVADAKSTDTAEVVSVLERGYTELVGIVYSTPQGVFVHPDNNKYCSDIFLTRRNAVTAQDGDKVVVKITSYPKGKMPGGEIVEVLGDSTDFFVEEESVIRTFGLAETFPDAVLQAAKRQSEREIAQGGREDFRGEPIITIDGEDTRDIDDAVTLSVENGKYRLGVHIADVSYYVKKGSVLEREAYNRGTSVYFPDRVLPMLPKELSNGICSLNEGEDRLTMSCILTIDGEGNVLSARMAEGVIRSAHRMTYTQVQAILDGEEAVCRTFADVAPMIGEMGKLALILEAKRAGKGGIDLEMQEAKIYMDEEGHVCIPEYKRTLAHRMIEQFMVSANEAVARFLEKQEMPALYRVHEPPSVEKATSLLTFLHLAGIPAGFDAENVQPMDYKRILDGLSDSPKKNILQKVMLRSMQKARYFAENLGHFGLASDCYCHFTSPIRRYPDLLVHSVLRLVLEGRKEEARLRYGSFVQEAGNQCSKTERNADEAERAVDDLYKTLYMYERMGQEMEATVSSVTKFGVFCELDNSVEGLVRLEELPYDEYEFLEDRMCMRGRRHSYAIGDRVRIKVVACDWGLRRTYFHILEEKSNGKKRQYQGNRL